MVETFTIPTWEKEAVDKAIARFAKKAAAYGKTFETSSGEPYMTKRAICKEDPVTHLFYEIDKEIVEVYDLSVESDVIRKDGYAVVAKLEHLEEGNFVRSFVDEPNPAWQKLPPRCEHCNTKHYRANTFIVRHEDGTEKQVGSTCLKDYCGIDPKYFAYLKALHDLFLRDDIRCYDFDSCKPHEKIYSMMETLALSFRVKKSQGYVKSGYPGSNKDKLMDLLKAKEKPTDEEMAFANEVAEEVNLMQRDDSFTRLNNQRIWFDNSIKPLLKVGYCKSSHIGYIAYAPVAFDHYLEAKAQTEGREALRKKQAETSQFIGIIGKKIEVDVAKMELVTSWENDWGYTYLYKIVDNNGNVLVWKSSRCVDPFKKLRGTVKDHNERDGVKQTIVTRCRAV